MSTKKPKGERRMPIASATETATVQRFLGNPATRKQEETSNVTEEILNESRTKKYRRDQSKNRNRMIIDFTRYRDYDLVKRVDAVSNKWSIPPGHFVVLCIVLGLKAIEDGSLNIEDYIETLASRSKLYQHTLRLEK